MRELPLKKLKNFGGKLGAELGALGCSTAGQACSSPAARQCCQPPLLNAAAENMLLLCISGCNRVTAHVAHRHSMFRAGRLPTCGGCDEDSGMRCRLCQGHGQAAIGDRPGECMSEFQLGMRRCRRCRARRWWSTSARSARPPSCARSPATATSLFRHACRPSRAGPEACPEASALQHCSRHARPMCQVIRQLVEASRGFRPATRQTPVLPRRRA